MKNLEGMALDLFNKFSLKETGKVGDWLYLSNERKIAWMADALVMANYFYKEVLLSIKPLAPTQKHDTVYAVGYADGARSQHVYMSELFREQYQKLLDEYEDFCYNIEEDT